MAARLPDRLLGQQRHREVGRRSGGAGMRDILTVTFSALMLAGCADGYDKSADINDCKRAISADRPISHIDIELSSSFGSSVAGIPGRDLPRGGSEPLPPGISTKNCV